MVARVPLGGVTSTCLINAPPKERLAIRPVVEEFKEEGKGMVWLGVQFEGSEEEIKSKLIPVFQTLFPDQDP